MILTQSGVLKMTKSVQEILARKAQRLKEEEEDNKLLADSYIEAASEYKKGLQSLASVVDKHILDLLSLKVEEVKEWLKSQKVPILTEEEMEQLTQYRRANIDRKYLGQKGEERKISTQGVASAYMQQAWKDGTLKLIDEEK